MTNLFYNLLNDRAIISVKGEDASSFLQGIITNDINKVNENTTIYSCILSPQGKYLFDFFIAKYFGNYLIECNKARIPELLKKLNIYKLKSKVIIEDISDNYQILALAGEGFLEKWHLNIAGETKQLDNGLIFVDPRSIKLSGRVILKRTSLENFVSANRIEEVKDLYELLRTSVAIPEGDKDLIIEKSFPLEFGFEHLNAIDFKKGCYIGQEVTSRTKYRGVIRKRIYKVISEGGLPEHGAEIDIGDKKVGILLSSYKNIGIAQLRLEDYEQAKLESAESIRCIDNNLEVLEVEWY